MQPRFIFTADDYGPIDFINRGICYAVKNGFINSVHVLSNIGKSQLKDALHQLNEHVPEGKTLDLGLHLTLTSGGPLHRNHGQNWVSTWGKMLKGNSFKPFTHFYFGYRNYLAEICNEFTAQHHQLNEALQTLKNSRLKLTAVSHHHGIFAIDDVLFWKYAHEFRGSANLALRSPKALPASANNSFFGLVVPLLNLTDRKEDRLEMERINAAFLQNQFKGPQDLRIKTPSYTEVGFYSSLGSLLTVDALHKKRIAKKVEAFNEMIERATSYPLKAGHDPDKKVVEYVFHLGDHTQGRRGFKQHVKHYCGINHNYFEDRQHELYALQASIEKHDSVLKNNLVGWDECGEVLFKRAV
jgi:predicted glycoside hydrolase/deacetylase ChbG (UPF0249 family)